ncbi:MAG TPA: hypothetical protein VM536_09775 [Chloroflexia bacterium]|nr:hypothetical protein [Chloroflexia bacterium]
MPLSPQYNRAAGTAHCRGCGRAVYYHQSTSPHCCRVLQWRDVLVARRTAEVHNTLRVLCAMALLMAIIYLMGALLHF